MKVSLNWIRELVPLPAEVDGAAAARILTDQGLEVESVLARGHDLAGVVVAEVVAVRPHPRADRLSLVRVRAGAGEEDVVCGAPNVPAPGGRVAWAPPGAVLPGGLRIEVRDIRGVPSPGMLCSERELGFGDEADGILILSPSAQAAWRWPRRWVRSTRCWK
jgi:phenylalanyl-tRNA synthetase beta chain